MNVRERSPGGSGVILIALVYILGTMIVHIPTWAQGSGEVVLYQENFDGQAQGWELEPGWRMAAAITKAISTAA